MADVFDHDKRSRIMAAIKGKNTTPEKIVRSLLHQMGYRFRLHQRTLPGVPDIVLPIHKKVIFVHGCFWHGHSGCKRASLPKTNKSFWRKKILGNKARDISARKKLNRMGWKSMVVWQCRISGHTAKLAKQIRRFIKI